MRAALSGFLDAAGLSGESRVALRSVVRNGGRLMGITWLENLLGLAYFAVMARYLGPAQYGDWAYGTSAYGLVIALVGFGLDTLIMIELGRDRPRAADTLGLMLTLRAALLVVGGIGLAAYAFVVEPDPESRMVLLLLIPALLGRGLGIWLRMCFVGYEQLSDYVRLVAAVRIAEFTGGVLYLVAGGGLIGIVILHSLCWVVEAGLGFRRMRARLARYRIRFDWRSALALLAQGAVLGLTIGGDTWLISGPVMLLRYSDVGMTALGQFATGLTVMMILVGATQSFLAAALPVLSRSGPSAAGMAAYARLIAAGAIAGPGALAVLGWLFGPAFMAWALGAPYAVTGALLAPFLLVTGIVLVPTAYVQVLLVSGLRWPWVTADIAGGLWLAAAFPAAVAAWDLGGAVFATGSAWFIRAAILVVAAETLALRPGRLRSTG